MDDGTQGVNPQGALAPLSLIVRGWQRTGALTRFFAVPSNAGILAPNIIYAAGTGPDSPSNYKGVVIASNAAMRQSGTVLIVWEHKMLPALTRAFPQAPTVPSHWPPHRFDVVWILDHENNGWLFTQLPQCLLAGDDPTAIP